MSEDYQQLLVEATTATDRAESIRTLVKILADDGGKDFISRLDRKDGELCIEILDQGLSEHKLSKTEKQTFFVALWKLAATHRRLPDSVILKERLEVSDEIRTGDKSPDTRVGKYKGCLVSVTTHTMSPKNNLDWIRQGFCKQVTLWSKLSHPNVLKLLGVLGDLEKGPFTTVSERMPHGPIVEYIKHNAVNRLDLLHGAAQGLKFLHDNGIVHGDPNGQNILVTNDTPPSACLSDFACMTLDFDEPTPFDVQLGHGTVAFKSPERFNPQKFGVRYALVAREADIYAFGMTIFQVLAGEMPFHDFPEAEVIDSVVNGLRPTKPQGALAIGFSDSLWDFVQLCWDSDRTRRPTATEVVEHLHEATTNWHTLMPATTPGPAKNEPEPMNYPESPSLQSTNSNVSSSVNEHELPQSGGEEQPHVDAPPDVLTVTTDPPEATPRTSEDRNESPSLLRRVRNAFRTLFISARTVVLRSRVRDERTPKQPKEGNHNDRVKGDNPPSPVLRGSCCWRS